MNNNQVDYTQPSPREAVFLAFLKGIDESFPDGDVIRVDGKPYTKSQLRAKVVSFLEPETASRVGHLRLSALAAGKAKNKKPADRFATLFKTAVVNHFGSKDHETLGTFGIAGPRDRRQATAAENVVKVARAAETKKARGTKGAAQKRAIKGAPVTEVTVDQKGKIQRKR